MRSLSNLLDQKRLNLQRHLVRVENCESCGKELKTYKMQLIGGSKKGEWTTITEECSCYFSRLTLEAVKRNKLEYFKEHSTINQALIHATLENYSPSNNSQIQAVKKATEFIEYLKINHLESCIMGKQVLGNHTWL